MTNKLNWSFYISCDQPGLKQWLFRIRNVHKLGDILELVSVLILSCFNQNLDITSNKSLLIECIWIYGININTQFSQELACCTFRTHSRLSITPNPTFLMRRLNNLKSP